MNEIKRLKAWYKKKIEDWVNTVCALGFTSMILNLLLMTFFLVTKGKIGLLFLLVVIVQGFGITFLTHEYEIEEEEENLKIFLKKIIKFFENGDSAEIPSHYYQVQAPGLSAHRPLTPYLRRISQALPPSRHDPLSCS